MATVPALTDRSESQRWREVRDEDGLWGDLRPELREAVRTILETGGHGDDPELFIRWLTIEHLLTSARELQGRGGGARPSLAVISADAATETILLLVAMSENPPRDRAMFEDVYVSTVRVLGRERAT